MMPILATLMMDEYEDLKEPWKLLLLSLLS